MGSGGIGMNYQMVFKRYEQKYLMTHAQKQLVLDAMKPHMQIDQYGLTTIRNLYFDTETYLLIRRSIEKTVYKEKLRIRSYQKTSPSDNIFLELKKKYQSVVYKRRITLPEDQALNFICGSKEIEETSQIANEIAYVRDFYETLRPVVFLAYEREAYCSLDGGDFRITFDENIRARTTELTTQGNDNGTLLLDEDLVLMEIKSVGGIPLWLTHVLSEQQIFHRPFSKYGEAYRKIIFENVNGGICYV